MINLEYLSDKMVGIAAVVGDALQTLVYISITTLLIAPILDGKDPSKTFVDE